MNKPNEKIGDSGPPSAEVSPSREMPASEESTRAPDVAVSARSGRVEGLSMEFAMGWASVSASGLRSYVVAMLGEDIIGVGVASLSRPDLDKARAEKRIDAYGFIIVYTKLISADSIQQVEVYVLGEESVLPQAKQLKLDRAPALRLFLMGSPRSGTSELGATLTKVLGLPWLGEGHAAPLFASAAAALDGDATSENGLLRFMAKQKFRDTAVDAAKRAYFYIHGSASFVDKTPGVDMIAAAPFLNECFPQSYFIFLRRNPVGNVLSRMVKFGGNFESHCRDWAAAMLEWQKVRTELPHYVEIEQEEMLASPNRVASKIAEYIGIPSSGESIFKSLQAGSLERTGAGVGKTSLGQTGWTSEQTAIFDRVCGPAMKAFGYN